jgi:hypothetical protein
MRTGKVARLGILAGLLAGGLGSAGCSSMNNTEKGAGIGGALGTAAGLGIGAATGNPRTGAIIGGLAGAGTGALVGNQADKEERRERDIQHATAVATAQAQQQRMGLFDVVDLTRKGHDDQVIINQIRATGSTFQLTASDLDHLKNEGVSSRVITEMQAARPVSPLATRVVAPPATTVIYEQPAYPAPVYVRPVYVPPPRPVVFVGGHYHRCW